jgi:hypothetical protein
MTRRRQRRRREKELRHAPTSVTPPAADGHVDGPVERLVYSREQAAQALGVNLATLDRRVVPAIATVKTEWSARLIPAELDGYLAERTEEPRMPRRRATRSGRRSTLPTEAVARIRHERGQGGSLAEIAHRLHRDSIPTGQGGRQWWPSTVPSCGAKADAASSAVACEMMARRHNESVPLQGVSRFESVASAGSCGARVTRSGADPDARPRRSSTRRSDGTALAGAAVVMSPSRELANVRRCQALLVSVRNTRKPRAS